MDIYLDEKLKTIYMNDFNNNVLKCPMDSWKLDKGTEEVMIELNQNPKIQTLYSKRYSNDPECWSTDSESYIKFAYSEDIEMKLLKEFIPNTIIIFNDPLLSSSNCYHRFSYPRDNPNYREREEDKFKMLCLTGEDYFRVNHIGIYLHCNEVDLHDKFWNYLKKELANIG